MAYLGVFVQRQMIPQQADIMTEQKPHPAAKSAAQGLFFAPQKAMVHHNHVRTGGMGFFKQFQPSRHAKHYFPHMRFSLHLQAVVAAVRDFCTVQVFI